MSPRTGKASGLLLLNSNALDAVLAHDSLTLRATGGVIDLYVFLGPEPGDVTRQLTDVIGKPALPPYWALGFHLCRWGYGSAAATRKVVDQVARSLCLYALCPLPSTLCPLPSALYPLPSTLYPIPHTLHPKF